MAAVVVVLVAPAGRAALNGALNPLESFLACGPTPGSALPAGQYPAWLSDVQRLPGDVAARTGPTPLGARLLAARGDEKLYAYREQGDGAVCFAYGHHVTACDPNPANWLRRLDTHAAAVLMAALG